MISEALSHRKFQCLISVLAISKWHSKADAIARAVTVTYNLSIRCQRTRHRLIDAWKRRKNKTFQWPNSSSSSGNFFLESFSLWIIELYSRKSLAGLIQVNTKLQTVCNLVESRSVLCLARVVSLFAFRLFVKKYLPNLKFRLNCCLAKRREKEIERESKMSVSLCAESPLDSVHCAASLTVHT